uniref:Uncharacterized protein n=1 Tax=Candidatus Caldatribacterium saccharofermentans TaxID=1454753 RepID=A0A7V4TIN4_9BACT
MRLAPDELYGVQTVLDNAVLLSVVEEPVVLVRDRVPEGGKTPGGSEERSCSLEGAVFPQEIPDLSEILHVHRIPFHLGKLPPPAGY